MNLFHAEITNDFAQLYPDEAQHILRVLRMKTGAQIHITNGCGTLASAQIEIIGKKIELQNIAILREDELPKQKLHIAIAPTKNIDRIEFFVEKAVEMGVHSISFLLCEHSERKILNIEKITKQAIAASKQSLRLHFPIIHELQKIKDFLADKNTKNIFVAHCNENFVRQDLTNITLPDEEEICFLVGPEGDFSTHEIDLMQQKNIRAVQLGNRRLRTETAGIFLAAWYYAQAFQG